MKTLKFLLPDTYFKILASDRTYTKVSAFDVVFELFVTGRPLTEPAHFLQRFNVDPPPDIRITGIKPVNKNLNVIKDVQQKKIGKLGLNQITESSDPQ